MPVYINGKRAASLFFNGKGVASAWKNGVKVFRKSGGGEEPVSVLLTPAMTSNTTPEPFIPSAKPTWNASVHSAWNGFNQSANPWAAGSSDNSSDGGVCDTWLAIYIGETPRKLTGVGLKARESYFTSHPKDFYIEGSNDGESWDILLTVTDAALPTESHQVFYSESFPGTVAYKNFRIHITKIHIAGSNPALNELYLYGY